jgi:hypothetical protein
MAMTTLALLMAILKITVNHNETFVSDEVELSVEGEEEAEA